MDKLKEELEKEVADFCSRFNDCDWTSGNCYYFAVILKDRFNGEIYYDVIRGHFVCKILDKFFFDYNGLYQVDYNHKNQDKGTKLIKWDDFHIYDYEQKWRIQRDCIF